jgi:hypothetical protein
MPNTLENPNNRRTVNLIARVAMDHSKKITKAKGLDARVEAVAKRWFSDRNKPAAKRAVSRTAVYGKAGTRGSKFLAKKGSPSKLRESSESRRADYARAKRVAAESLAKLYKLKGQAATEYVDRVLGAKGDAYLSSEKKTSKKYFGGTRKGSAVNVKGVRSWNASRVARRASGKWGHAHGRKGFRETHPFAKKHAAAVKKAKATLAKASFKKIKRAHAEDWTMAKRKKKGSLRAQARKALKGRKIGGYVKAGAVKPAKRRRTSAKMKRAQAKAAKVMRLAHKHGLTIKAAWAKFGGKKAKASKRKHRKGKKHSSTRSLELRRRKAAFSNPKRRRHARKARHNVSALGDLALTNPTMAGAKQYFLAYALPVTIAGGAAGAVHAFAASQGVSAKISEYAEKIPVAGEYLAKVPFTIQGAIVGAGLALIAPMIGGKAGEALALTGGAALIFGGGIDAFNILSAKLGDSSDSALGDLAFTNESALGDLAFGDLAFTNSMGDLGFNEGSGLSGLADSAPFGDGLAYMTAPLTADLSQVDYGQASLQDAYYSGADFSAAEGQAILNGKRDFLRAFGTPPIRQGAKAAAHSHLAGRHGHRWGWLVKMLGFSQAQRIAALPPKERIEVLRKIRSAALAAAQQSQIAEKAQQLAHEASVESMQDSAPISGAAAQAPAGAAGAAPSNGLGDLAFAGDDYGATLFAQA